MSQFPKSARFSEVGEDSSAHLGPGYYDIPDKLYATSGGGAHVNYAQDGPERFVDGEGNTLIGACVANVLCQLRV